MTDFKAKMHQIRFRLGLRPRPRWGSLQPRPHSWIWPFWGPLRGRGRGWAREEEGGEVEGREMEVPQVTVESGPLRAFLRHCLNPKALTLKP